MKRLFEALFGLTLDLADADRQREGVDFDLPGVSLEVKLETYPPQRVFLEFRRDDGEPSGHAASRADVFIHVFPRAGVAYLMNGEQVRQFIAEHCDEYEHHEVRTRSGKEWSVYGIAVPIEDLERHVSLVKLEVPEWVHGGKT